MKAWTGIARTCGLGAGSRVSSLDLLVVDCLRVPLGHLGHIDLAVSELFGPRRASAVHQIHPHFQGRVAEGDHVGVLGVVGLQPSLAPNIPTAQSPV